MIDKYFGAQQFSMDRPGNSLYQTIGGNFKDILDRVDTANKVDSSERRS